MRKCRHKEVSFRWSHYRMTFTDSKVRTTLFIIDSGSERVKYRANATVDNCINRSGEAYITARYL